MNEHDIEMYLADNTTPFNPAAALIFLSDRGLTPIYTPISGQLRMLKSSADIVNDFLSEMIDL